MADLKDKDKVLEHSIAFIVFSEMILMIFQLQIQCVPSEKHLMFLLGTNKQRREVCVTVVIVELKAQASTFKGCICIHILSTFVHKGRVEVSQLFP